MEKINVKDIENLKKEFNFTDYRWENLGGVFEYNGYSENYKRNKRDVKKYLKYDNRYFELYENISYRYNKALIYKEIEKNNYLLISYETAVAEYKNGKMILYGYYSKTTAEHINDFLYKFNYKTMSKKEIEKNINIEF